LNFLIQKSRDPVGRSHAPRRILIILGSVNSLIWNEMRFHDPGTVTQTEAAIGVAVLNRMLMAGRPNSVRRQPVIA
jgi:hypothetical protein